MFIYGTLIVLIGAGFLLAGREAEPSQIQRLLIVTAGLLPVAVLAFLVPGSGAPSFEPTGVLLVLGLPVIACLWFAQTPLARKRPWLLLFVIPALWAAGLFIGLTLAVNLGIAQP